MATSKEFCEYVVEHLQRVGEVSTKKMMGEYLLYFRGKLAGMVCDNCLFLKPVTGVLQLLPDADRGYPYEGSKTLMVMIDCVEDRELMAQVMERLYQELPEGKSRKK